MHRLRRLNVPSLREPCIRRAIPELLLPLPVFPRGSRACVSSVRGLALLSECTSQQSQLSLQCQNEVRHGRAGQKALPGGISVLAEKSPLSPSSWQHRCHALLAPPRGRRGQEEAAVAQVRCPQGVGAGCGVAGRGQAKSSG